MEIKQYLLLNKELTLSTAKWSVQTAHAASRFERAVFTSNHPPLFSQLVYQEWVDSDEKKIAVRASKKQLEELARAGWVCVRDAGYNEVEPNTLTVVISPPLKAHEVPSWMKRLQLYKT